MKIFIDGDPPKFYKKIPWVNNQESVVPGHESMSKYWKLCGLTENEIKNKLAVTPSGKEFAEKLIGYLT